MAIGPTDGNPTSSEPLDSAADRIEAILFECLEADDPSKAIDTAADANPKFAVRLRLAYRELLRWDLVVPSSEGVSTDIGSEPMPDRLGHYRLLKRIGAGGMGVVFLARDDSLNRTVALKLIRPEHLFMSGARERFQREVETVARLQHPGIVPVFGVGKQEGVPYFTMEHIRGCSVATALADLQATNTLPDSRALLDVVARHANADEATPQSDSSGATRRIDGLSWPDTCVAFAIQVAEALQHAHERGILHRDVKPSNILLTSDGRALLLDFGLAWSDAEGQRLTGSTSELGSLPYLPPEHLSGDAPDPNRAADVYSLGVTLYEMLTLRNPFLSKRAEETRRNILGARPLRLRREQRGVSWELETVCLAAMDPDPKKRYRTMLDFQRDLERVRDRQTIATRRPGLVRRTRRWAQRHPAAVAALAVAFVSGVVGLSIFGVREWQARVESDRLRESAEVERYGALLSNADVEARIGVRPRESRRLLAQCREQDRGFEWHHLEFVTDQSVRTFTDFAGPVQDLAYAPDSRSFVVSSQDQVLCRRGVDGVTLWSLPDTAISTLTMAPTADGGHVIVCAQIGGALQLRGLDDGHVRATFSVADGGAPPNSEIVDVVASRDGRRVFTASSDGRICEWDLIHRKFLRVLGQHRAQAHCLTLSGDGKRLASGGFDRTARVFDTHTGTQIIEWSLPGWCFDLAWAPDQHTLLIANQAQLQMNDANDPTRAPRVLERGAVVAVECSSDGSMIGATVSRRALRIYRVVAKEPLKLRAATRLLGHEGIVQQLCFRPDGAQIATGSSARDVRLWDPGRSAAVATRLHARMVSHMALAAPGVVVSADSTGRLRASTNTGAVESLVLEAGSQSPAHDDPVVAILPAENGVISVDADGTTIRWQRDGSVWQPDVVQAAVQATCATVLDATHAILGCDGGQVVVLESQRRSWQAHDSRITAMLCREDVLWTGALDGSLKKWSVRTGELLREEHRHPSWIGTLLLEPEGKWLATCCADTLIRILDTKTGALINTLKGHGRAPAGLATDGSSTRLISSGGYDNELRFWQPVSGRCLLSMRQPTPVISMVFDVATNTLTLGGRTGNVRHMRTRAGGPRRFERRPVQVDTTTSPPGKHR